MFMGNGSIIALSLLHGGAHAIILFIYFFLRKELILLSFLDVLSVVSCSLVNGARHNNEPAHRHKK